MRQHPPPLSRASTQFFLTISFSLYIFHHFLFLINFQKQNKTKQRKKQQSHTTQTATNNQTTAQQATRTIEQKHTTQGVRDVRQQNKSAKTQSQAGHATKTKKNAQQIKTEKHKRGKEKGALEGTFHNKHIGHPQKAW